jgi:hypothetical protein
MCPHGFVSCRAGRPEAGKELLQRPDLKNLNGSVCGVLYEAAHVLLTRSLKGCAAPKSWVIRIAKRATALARKLAVIVHRMLARAPSTNRRAPLTGVASNKEIGC